MKSLKGNVQKDHIHLGTIDSTEILNIRNGRISERRIGRVK